MAEKPYRDIRLVTTQFGSFKSFRADALNLDLVHAVMNKALSCSDEQRITQVAGEVFELVLRYWLGLQLPLIEKRALKYKAHFSELAEYYPETGGWFVKCDEIDAIVGREEIPQCLVEIRCSCQRESQRKLTNQLQRRLRVATQLWPNIAGATITVKTGPWRYRKWPARLLRPQMALDIDLFWSMVNQGKSQFLVVHLLELQAYAESLGIVFAPRFLEVVHMYANMNFLRIKKRYFARAEVPKEVKLPYESPWAFSQVAAV